MREVKEIKIFLTIVDARGAQLFSKLPRRISAGLSNDRQTGRTELFSSTAMYRHAPCDSWWKFKNDDDGATYRSGQVPRSGRRCR